MLAPISEKNMATETVEWKPNPSKLFLRPLAKKAMTMLSILSEVVNSKTEKEAEEPLKRAKEFVEKTAEEVSKFYEDNKELVLNYIKLFDVPFLPANDLAVKARIFGSKVYRLSQVNFKDLKAWRFHLNTFFHDIFPLLQPFNYFIYLKNIVFEDGSLNPCLQLCIQNLYCGMSQWKLDPESFETFKIAIRHSYFLSSLEKIYVGNDFSSLLMLIAWKTLKSGSMCKKTTQQTSYWCCCSKLGWKSTRLEYTLIF